MRKLAPLSLVALAFALLAGCGSSPNNAESTTTTSGVKGNGVASEAPAQILRSALAAFRSAKSLTLDGDVGSGTNEVTVDLTIFDNGDFDGTIGENGTTAKVIKIGAQDYLYGAKGFWQGNGLSAALAAKVAGRWVSLPDSQMGFGDQFSISTFGSGLSSNNGPVSAGTTGTIDGQPAISVHQTTKKGAHVVIWVATTGPAYPLQATGLGSGQDQGTLNLSGYDQGTLPTVPAGAATAQSLVGGT